MKKIVNKIESKVHKDLNKDGYIGGPPKQTPVYHAPAHQVGGSQHHGGHSSAHHSGYHGSQHHGGHSSAHHSG
eukprot:CAMPEP_0174345382 /NCGR_PEP_ID=MMETSP0811_2-20130205/838_1 /TAXON_ID=73025 ORGANISM="Eutreptiella gymnastica-like, Strain CCMP1594" /NCGR_SAMPLE_ID=MMETSP0811_2 /ASSEMBLY_ACC=CAM_ASM_000667 /LENGTH=72 /DNA_ID=CAMNT_0015469043 /DNA_START=31 /DNA_END=245 /DNA_ORIENTATION=+